MFAKPGTLLSALKKFGELFLALLLTCPGVFFSGRINSAGEVFVSYSYLRDEYPLIPGREAE